jgi:hypothetical protein
MGHAGEYASLRDGGIVTRFLDATQRDVLLAEALQKHAAGFVVSNDAYRQHIDSQICQVEDGIGAAAGNHRSLAMFQNEHGRLARDARDFAEDEFIRHQVPDHRDGYFGEVLNDVA